jgi:hypothetical protein
MKKNTKSNVLHPRGVSVGHCPGRGQGGQVALVVLLVSAVTLMLGLTASRKGTVDTNIGHDQELSAKAFAAAEGGLEYVLSQLAVGNIVDFYRWPEEGGLSSAGSRAEVELIETGGGTSFYALDNYQAGETAYFWLRNPTNFSERYGSQEIGLCWETGDNQALAIHLFYDDGSYGVTRLAIDEEAGRRSLNGFVDPGTLGVQSCAVGYEGLVYNYSADVGLDEAVLLVVMPLYNSTRLGVVARGGSVLPAQGYEITSRGVAANVQRRLRMNYGWPVPPYYFVDGVFSGSSISSN